MSDKLDKMWVALEAHEPQRGYSEAWQKMLKERTEKAAEAAALAAKRTAWAAEDAAKRASREAWDAARAARAAQRAIDAIKKVQT